MWNSFGIGGVSLLGIAVHCYGIAMVLLYDFRGIPGELLGDCRDTTMVLLWECFASKIGIAEFPVVLLGIAVILLWHDCGIPVIAGWIACCGVALVLL